MDFLDKLRQIDETIQQTPSGQQVAGESVGKTVEREYCFWVKPTADGWNWLFNANGIFHLDILMPIVDGRRRIRIDEDGKSELTIKTFHDGAKLEENADIGFNLAISFYDKALLNHMFRRVRVEPNEEAVAIKGHHWDIDMFYKTQDTPDFKTIEDFKDYIQSLRGSTNATDWVKVELEVEEFVDGADVASLIPFPYDEIMSSNPKSEEEREFIRDYWERVTRL